MLCAARFMWRNILVIRAIIFLARSDIIYPIEDDMRQNNPNKEKQRLKLRDIAAIVLLVCGFVCAIFAYAFAGLGRTVHQNQAYNTSIEVIGDDEYGGSEYGSREYGDGSEYGGRKYGGSERGGNEYDSREYGGGSERGGSEYGSLRGEGESYIIDRDENTARTIDISENAICESAVLPSEAQRDIAVPILMYHSILNSRKSVYIVSEKQLEADIAALKKAGFTAVFPSEVIAYAKGKGVLPPKPVMITFDDGHYNNMYYGLPILKKHNMKALLSPVGVFSENSTVSGDDSNPNYSHVTWQQISELMDSGVFEIGNHSYNMHSYRPRYGMGRRSGESDEIYRKAVREDLEKLQNKLNDCAVKATGYYAKTNVYNGENAGLNGDSAQMRKKKAINVLAFPFGKYNDTLIEVAEEMGFEMLLTCNEGVSKVRFGEYQKPLMLKRINRSGEYSTQKVINLLEKYCAKL